MKDVSCYAAVGINEHLKSNTRVYSELLLALTTCLR
jgi:hypothetical protein